jgi:hypothetical protein
VLEKKLLRQLVQLFKNSLTDAAGKLKDASSQPSNATREGGKSKPHAPEFFSGTTSLQLSVRVSSSENLPHKPQQRLAEQTRMHSRQN